jgi:hypothetical protein
MWPDTRGVGELSLLVAFPFGSFPAAASDQRPIRTLYPRPQVASLGTQEYKTLHEDRDSVGNNSADGL